MSVTPPEFDGPIAQPSFAFGDTIGGSSIAMGMASAQFHREKPAKR
jgi:hypothetical protein